MTEAVRYERMIGATPEVVFDAFTSPDGQLAFYGQDDRGWIVRSESDVRVGGSWTILFGPSPEQLYRHQHLFRTIDRPRYLLLSTTETRLDGTTVEFETDRAELASESFEVLDALAPARRAESKVIVVPIRRNARASKATLNPGDVDLR